MPLKESFKLSGIGVRILLFGAIAALLTVLLSMGVSALILRGFLPEGQIPVYSAVLCALSVGIACIAACGKQDAGILPLCLGIASVYFALVLLTKTILFPGATDGLLLRGLSVYGVAVGFAFLMTACKKGRGTRRHALGR